MKVPIIQFFLHRTSSQNYLYIITSDCKLLN
jgi:hypothetical protein